MVATPFTYYHQYVLLLIPLLVVGAQVVARRRWWLLGLVAVLGVGVDANQVVWVLARRYVLDHGLWRLFSLPFVLAMVLLACCGLELWRIRWRCQGARKTDASVALETPAE